MHVVREFPVETPASAAISVSGVTNIAIIGNSLPRRCGIATFTTDLQQSLAATSPGLKTCIVAMTDYGCAYDYPHAVRMQIADSDMADYIRVADELNASGCDIVSLQHEFGIFGGPAGDFILALLARLTMPVVTTLHTVLASPTADQRRVLSQVCARSSRVIVMAKKGQELLQEEYQVPVEKIEIIPHGIPDMPFSDPDQAKVKLGFSGRTVILTFGLLSPSKGIEVMIDAMPEILKCRPDAVYVVLGATHPNLVRHQGETYRANLVARVRELGIEDHVVFLDQFVDKTALLDYISMCDVYVTPYLNEAQMTSGTLAYSFGLGRAVVSTPYWHAKELLADGYGVLVPFGNARATGLAIRDLLADDATLQAMRRRAYECSRSMTWARTAARYLETFADVCWAGTAKSIDQLPPPLLTVSAANPPDVHLDHFLAMCDDTGLLQHAVYSIPDRSHGYCIDDNARALLLACAISNQGGTGIPEPVIGRFASFIAHAWNPANGRFRNFMSFDRLWHEEAGSEDSHGRTLWALGACARADAVNSRRMWASSLFQTASSALLEFRSPRAWAFALLGLNSYCYSMPDDSDARRLRIILADRLVSILAQVESPGWVWFEDGLTYDNARMPQALIETGLETGVSTYTDIGLRTLHWLMARQTTAEGKFRPVGTSGFGDQKKPPRAFDQQPVEAAATVSACLSAWRADGDVMWQTGAKQAFSWFLGDNDLGVSLVDVETGSCRDGLHPDRANQNRGGESVVSYLLALSGIRQAYKTDWDRG